jgi:hypothetical protein
VKQTVTVILAVGLIFNSLLPLRNILPQSPDMLNNTIVAGSTVFNVLSATVAPFKIIGGIVKKDITLCDEVRTTPKGKKSVPAKDAGAASAVIQRSVEEVRTVYRDMVQAAGIGGMSCGASAAGLLSACQHHDPGGYLILIFLLAYLVVLSRMSIPAAARQLNRNFKPGLRKDGRVSYLGRRS